MDKKELEEVVIKIAKWQEEQESQSKKRGGEIGLWIPLKCIALGMAFVVFLYKTGEVIAIRYHQFQAAIVAYIEAGKQ
jgi:hypothetical protein